MKKIALAGLIVVAASLSLVPSTEARPQGFHHRPAVHARVVVGVGPAIWWGPYPYWYYPPPPYYVYSPPPVVVQEPPVYVQQPALAGPPAPPAPAAQSQTVEAYWYYCPSSKGYYPSVPTCPEPWVKVPPRQD